MSDTLNALITLGLKVHQVKDLDLADAKHDLDAAWEQLFQTGTGAGQANKLFADERSLADGANEELDLAGGLLDAFGATLTFAKVKVLAFKNKSTTQTLSVGGAAANAFSAFLGDPTDVVKIAPGGFALLILDPAGVTVTADTGDKLKIANSAGAVCAYDIVIVGH